MPDSVSRLHVCVTCRAGRALEAGEIAPGARLHARLAALVAEQPAAPCQIREVVCLASCTRGCTATISMPGKWSYLLGDLTLDHAADILTYAAAYTASTSGTVLPSRRPASLRNVILARFPALDLDA